MPEAGIVVVGASWGGLQALTTLVGALPAGFPLPTVFIQHRSRESTGALAQLLQDASKLPVCEVEDKAPVVAGHVYVAPADYHLLMDREHFSLSTDAPFRYSRPSIDVTFESASLAYGAGTIGVVLTGANADGSEGLRLIVNRKGTAVIQDPTSAESPTMPRAAVAAVPEARVLRLEQIGSYLVKVASERTAKAARPGSRA